MSVCTNFGEYKGSSQLCDSCKVTMSCKREKIRVYKSRRKEKVVRHNVSSINRNKFSGIGHLGRIKTRLLRALSFSYKPVATMEIYSEVEKWGKEKIPSSKVRDLLKELSKMGYLIQIIRGNSYYWITIPNYEKSRNSLN
jgi:hypothetical protein